MKERPILFKGDMVRAILDGRKTQTRRVVPSWQLPRETEGPHDDYPDLRFMSVAQRHPRWGFGVFGETAEKCMEKYNTEYAGLCPYGQPGDRLWVRETCRAHEITDQEAYDDAFGLIDKLGLESPPCGLDGVIYEADGEFIQIENSEAASNKWAELHHYRGDRGAKVPSIHMPRWASRILLEITDVRVERLQDISEKNAIAEGIGLSPNKETSYRVELPKGSIADAVDARSSVSCFKRLWQSINGPGSWDANPWVWVVEFKRIEP